MVRRPPRSTLFPTRRSSDLPGERRFRANLDRRLRSQRYEQHEVHDERGADDRQDRKSTRLNSSHSQISYAVFCLKKKKAKLLTTIKQSMNLENRNNDTLVCR